MGFKQFDFECTNCGHVHGDLTWVPYGEEVGRIVDDVKCPDCGLECEHETLMSCPAKYMGDKPWAPRVSGGKFDTTGHKELPKLPVLDTSDFDNEIRKKTAGCGDQKEIERIIRETPGAPSMADYAEVCRKPEFKEAKRERARVMKENYRKRQRDAAIAKDMNIDMRRNPLPGDPAF